MSFNLAMSKGNLSDHLVIAFDPSYLPKSGKKTPNIDKFWSGCLGKAVKGIEIGGLGVVDVEANQAFHLEAIQTPNQEVLQANNQTLIDHYAQIIVDRSKELCSLSQYLAVDGYFSKKKFVDQVTEQASLHLISKLRKDANLKYLYQGPQKPGRGRPRKFDGKIDLQHIDRSRLEIVHEEEEVTISQLICYHVGLKRTINLAFVEFLDAGQPTGKYGLFYSTDLDLEGEWIYWYYKSRFQIEFLFRDAKQHAGLKDCQSVSENKLHFHFNASLTTVSVAKVSHIQTSKLDPNRPFSMADVKTSHFNELMLDLFLSSFQINPNLTKNKATIRKLLNFGTIAA